MSLVLIIAAVVFAVWAALADAGHVSVGVPFQLLAVAVACLAGSFIPWPGWRYDRR